MRRPIHHGRTGEGVGDMGLCVVGGRPTERYVIIEKST